MDKLGWFKFSISDWIMGKIMKCPEVTQARFIRLCCLYWNKECILSVEDAEIEIDREHLDILIAKKVVKQDDDGILIRFLDEQKGSVKVTSEKRRLAVNERWNKVKQNSSNVGDSNTSVLNFDTSVLQRDTEESREEERRVEKIEKSRGDNKKGVEKKSVLKKPLSPDLEVFKEKARLSFKKHANEFGTPFMKLWLELIQTKKWKRKSQSALDMSLKLVIDYDEPFASAMVKKAIAGDYQGIAFEDTPINYEKYLKQKNGIAKPNTATEKAESVNRMVDLARQILGGDASEDSN